MTTAKRPNKTGLEREKISGASGVLGTLDAPKPSWAVVAAGRSVQHFPTFTLTARSAFTQLEGTRMARSRDAGLKKRCSCNRRKWATCPHPWWFGFHHNGVEHRFSLNKETKQDTIDADKAKELRDHYRSLVRAGQCPHCCQPGPTESTLLDTRVTFGYVADQYLAKHVNVDGRRENGRKLMAWYVAALKVAEIPTSHRGATVKLQDKPIAEVTTADVEAIRDGWRRRTGAACGGRIGADRALKRLRHLFNWAIKRGYTDQTPFRRHGVALVEFATETGRSRRLEEGEEVRLREHASPYLRDVITAALQTGCRLGELLALQWRDVRWTQGVLYLPAEKTKTNEARDVPITTGLAALLQMRRHAPDGADHPGDAFCFGNEVGERVTSIRIEWDRACEAAKIRGLHFHDLRREFASRLLESPGVSPHEVSGWLGHANITTTSRYLKTTRVGLQHTARKFEQAQAPRPKPPKKKQTRIRTPFAHAAAATSTSITVGDATNGGKSVN